MPTHADIPGNMPCCPEHVETSPGQREFKTEPAKHTTLSNAALSQVDLSFLNTYGAHAIGSCCIHIACKLLVSAAFKSPSAALARDAATHAPCSALQEASPPPMSDYYQVLGHAQEMLATVSEAGLPELRESTAAPLNPHGHGSPPQSSTRQSHAAAAASEAKSTPLLHTPARGTAAKGCRDLSTPPSTAAAGASGSSATERCSQPTYVTMGSKLASPRDLITLEAALLRKLNWRLNDPCAFDWAASLILTAHPTPPGCEPGPVARDLLLRASTVLDLAVLHPWCSQQCELSLGAAAVATAGMEREQLLPALSAAGAPKLLASAVYAPAQRLIAGCAGVCPPLEGHCLVEAAVHEFHPSEFLWLQSHCEESRGLVAALQ
mgnify:CR=1 FL=1